MFDIFLEKNRSVLGRNVESDVNIDFDVKNRILPDENLVDDFSLYEQFIKERDECTNYRVILNINPLCSNVLFNTNSEIVVNEGSQGCKCLNFDHDGWDKITYAPNATNSTNPIRYSDAIRNTEYSHKSNGKFVYHCGIDIFNNHMLRKKIFMHINKTNYKDGDSAYRVYNTLADYLRDANGNIISEAINIKHSSIVMEGETETKRHIYDTNSLFTLKNAFYERCYDSNGWWGFTNPGMINIRTSKNSSILTNEMLSDNKPCEFIDMYPDRSLYSFVPKYNNNRRRIEKNWDYCLTYPYMKDYDFIDTICGGVNGAIKAKIKVVTSSSGVRLLQCTSLFKHSFFVGSYINFYYYTTNDGSEIPEPSGENVIRPIRDEYFTSSASVNVSDRSGGDDVELAFFKYQKEIRIYSVGDLNGNNLDRIFSVKYDDIKNIYDNFASFGCFYKKIVNNTECSYYARKFKKIKNQDGSEILSDVNKTAFSKNIYGDDIAQVIFTDNVDLFGLKDENGRDLSEIYFTVIKRNAGNEKWYKDKDTGNPLIEESHCFGVLTSGIDFSGVDVNEEPFDYNIHYLHNLDESVCTNETTGVEDWPARNTFSAWGDTILAGMPKYIESGITIDDDEFYGDIVEFDNYNYERNVIGNVFHRFNTMQREIFDIDFRDVFQDIITHDDYDEVNLNSGFTVERYYCNDVVNSLHNYNSSANTSTLMYGNIMPEGYFYNPHMRIKVKDEENVKRSDALYVNYDNCQVSFDLYGGDIIGIILKVLVPVDYGFIKGDYVAVYDKINGDVIWGVIKSFSDMYLTVYMNYDYFYGLDVPNHRGFFLSQNAERRFFMFWTPDSVPTHARLCVNSSKFAWKNIKKMSDVDNNSDLYDVPFTNGCHYIQKNMNFFLRRQDPRGEYGLSVPKFKDNEQTVFNVMTKYVMNGSEKVDLTRFDYINNKDLNICY